MIVGHEWIGAWTHDLKCILDRARPVSEQELSWLWVLGIRQNWVGGEMLGTVEKVMELR